MALTAAAAVLAFAFTLARTTLALEINGWDGAGCTGANIGNVQLSTGECLLGGACSYKSASYDGVPNQIQFFISGGGHDGCTNGPQLVLGPGAGCATAPDGVNWESFIAF